MDISIKLKEIRKTHNLSQVQLAKELHVSRAAIAKWESNRGLPDISNLLAISNIYHISLDELLENQPSLEEKLVRDSQTKKWHYLVIAYLIATLFYIVYLFFLLKALLIGFFIATVWVLIFELRIFMHKNTSSYH